MSALLSGRPWSRRGVPPIVQTEAFSILRSNLDVALEDIKNPTILVTSAREGEGKSFTASNLALSFAAAGRRVGIIDLDLRRPSLHTRFGVSNDAGASDVLRAARRPGQCFQQIEVNARIGQRGSLRLLPGGESAPDLATELLSTKLTAELVDSMVGRTGATEGQSPDIVIIDAPPVLPVADALIIGRLCTGALLVVAAGETPVTAALRAKDALTRNQTRLLGTVLNARTPARFDPESAYEAYVYGA